MTECFNVKSNREGVYLLWQMNCYDDAMNFIISSSKNTKSINDKLNSIYHERVRRGDDSKKTMREIEGFLRKYNNETLNESLLIWMKQESMSGFYFWLWIIKNHIANFIIHEDGKIKYSDIVYNIIHYPDDNNNVCYDDYEEKMKEWIEHGYLLTVIPNAREQSYPLALFLFDILSISLEQKKQILSDIKSDYLDDKLQFRKNFSWLDNADEEHIEWVMEQFKLHDDIFEYTRWLRLTSEMQRLAIPAIYSLWDAHPDTKRLFLTALRKRYANMKHRKKVADKSPVNIRISESSKKKLVKLEKYFNRNRADVIEHLIEQAWAERSNKK